MPIDFSMIDFHGFVDKRLAEHGFKILLITKPVMEERIDEFMNLVNSIRREYRDVYRWTEETKEYFLNGLNEKWKYSYTIVNKNNELLFVNFASLYGDNMHVHCTYTRSDSRNLNLAKIHMVKLCQTGLDNGLIYQEGYFPKNNNGSIILYLRMGWEIQSIRNNKDLFMLAKLENVRNRTYKLLTEPHIYYE